MQERKFIPVGTLVLEQDAAGDNAYVIESGKISISMRDADGDEIFLAELGPGALIGEMAIVLGGGRRANARAQENVVLIVVPGSDLQESAKAPGQMRTYLMELIESRQHNTQMALRNKRQEKFLLN